MVIVDYFDVESYRRSPAWVEYRKKWADAIDNTPEAPIHVDIELNSSCSYICSHCHQAANPRPYTYSNMPLDRAMALIDECASSGVLSLKFNWRGESLIYPHWREVFLYALRKGFVDIIINTHLGVELSDEDVRIIAALPTVKISCDSILHYKDVRVSKDRKVQAQENGNLELVMSNLRRVLQYRSSVRINRHKLKNTETDSEFMAALSMYVRPEQVELYSGIAQERNEKKHFLDRSESGERVYCGMPSRRILVSAAGNKYPCCVPYSESKAMRVGSTETKIVDAFMQADVFRSKLKNGQYGITPDCANCPSSDSYARTKRA